MLLVTGARVLLLGRHVERSSHGTTGTTGMDMWTVTITVQCPACTLTLGYWSTHNDTHQGGAPSDPTWDLLTDPINGGPENPGESLFFFLSGKTYFETITMPSLGNAYYIGARQWIAATLNLLAGSGLPASAQDDYANLQSLFANFTPAEVTMWDHSIGGFVPGFGDATRNDVIGWAGVIASFNEGDIGPGHCDAGDGLSAAVAAS